MSLVVCLLWPCRCVARMDISAEAEAAGVHAGCEGWEEWAMFCSEECRIHNECDRFFRSMWLILCRSMLICIYLDDGDLYDKLFILLNTMIHKYDSFLNSL